MITQGGLLALLADSDHRWQRLQGRYLLRQPPYPRSGLSRGDAHSRPTPAQPGPEVAFDVAATTRPFRLRVERALEPQAAEPKGVPDLAVDDGTALWMQTGAAVQQLRFRTPTDPWIAAVSGRLFPRGPSAGHRLVVTGEGEAAGRACWLVQAQAVLDPPPLTGETDGELMIDQQTGLVLSQRWYHRGTLLRSALATSLHVDGPANPEQFTFCPPVGAYVTAGAPIIMPRRYRPAVVVGLLTAMAGDAIATLARAARRGRQQ